MIAILKKILSVLMITLDEYYIANKEPDCEWVIMPRTNISAYLGSASYMEM